MKQFQNLLLTISLLFLVGCGGGSGSSATPTVVDPPTSSNLAKSTLIYNQTPKINEDLILTIEDNTSEATSAYTWKITSEPASSNLQLNVSADGKSTQLTPKVPGKYKITATPLTGDVIETQFSLANQFEFNANKLEDYDSNLELSKQIGIISNQAWVYSETLTQTAIEAIVSNYSSLNIIGFDEVRGLLIEFDDANAQSQLDINKIEAVTGIESVDLRVYEGSKFNRLAQKIADDGSAFDDGGDNWHLEHIGIEKAWDISTGNSDFFIGVLDGSATFQTLHQDLKGRFKEATRATRDFDETDETLDIIHGTSVSGTIAAISNNKKGMSGINWTNQLIAGKGGYAELSQFLERDDIFMLNMSLSLLPNGIPKRFDPSSANSIEEMLRISMAQTSEFRKLSSFHRNKLVVFGAGNGHWAMVLAIVMGFLELMVSMEIQPFITEIIEEQLL